jgi:hypothetical protein
MPARVISAYLWPPPVMPISMTRAPSLAASLRRAISESDRRIDHLTTKGGHAWLITPVSSPGRYCFSTCCLLLLSCGLALYWYQIRSAPMFQTRHVLGSEISKGTVPGLAGESAPLFLRKHHRSMELLVLQRISLLDHNSPLLLLLIQPDQRESLYIYKK